MSKSVYTYTAAIMPHDSPPPSTLAAALLKNLSKPEDSAAELKADKNAFQQLLAELLPPSKNGTGNETDDRTMEDAVAPLGGAASTTGIEGDAYSSSTNPIKTLTLNFKLMQVIVSAGLMVLLQDDPFASIDQQTAQAEDCLSILRLTVQRTPSVLVFNPTSGLPSAEKQPLAESMGNVPLYLWLLPRIIPLLGQPELRSLQKSLLETLKTIVIEIGKLPKAWGHVRLLLSYLRICAESWFFHFYSF